MRYGLPRSARNDGEKMYPVEYDSYLTSLAKGCDRAQLCRKDWATNPPVTP